MLVFGSVRFILFVGSFQESELVMPALSRYLIKGNQPPWLEMSEIVRFYLCSSLKKNKEVELTSQAGAVERNGIERWLDRYRREGERSEELARNFFSSFDAKTLVSTGSFGKWKLCWNGSKTKNQKCPIQSY